MASSISLTPHNHNFGSGPEIIACYAQSQNGVIGDQGRLPWHLPADLKRFKAITSGKPMVMGRKTFESLGKPLPGRRHIVLTRNPDWQASGAEVAGTIEQAVALAGAAPALVVIGGAEILELFRDQDWIDRYETTVIWRDYTGDTRLRYQTLIDQGDPFIEVAREDHPAEGGSPAFTFFTAVRERQ